MSNKTAVMLGREIEEGLATMVQTAGTLAEDAGRCQFHAVEARLDRVRGTLRTTLHGLRIQLKKLENREGAV